MYVRSNAHTHISTSSVMESPDFVGVSHLIRTSTRVATDESAALIICFWRHFQLEKKLDY
jgi:hypothetical protein